ncbi:Hypothetical Protein FCC1311_060202 [Hondaea fermentalgiana]|uniref:Apple domain-containing protein n=1 Tax=Hondaea fermentalgiana TaxID=2315210 RepID=A0A2R5GFZ4_9STRA|nr:Hypothetical Protein FCC1311_060202 [Hondaea fermentalgiana]|eukprot:GBG29800.1 Hypothetical Protein FCC1311_060202 [Hondaea fermentalgiana]
MGPVFRSAILSAVICSAYGYRVDVEYVGVPDEEGIIHDCLVEVATSDSLLESTLELTGATVSCEDNKHFEQHVDWFLPLIATRPSGWCLASATEPGSLAGAWREDAAEDPIYESLTLYREDLTPMCRGKFAEAEDLAFSRRYTLERVGYCDDDSDELFATDGATTAKDCAARCDLDYRCVGIMLNRETGICKGYSRCSAMDRGQGYQDYVLFWRTVFGEINLLWRGNFDFSDREGEFVIVPGVTSVPGCAESRRLRPGAECFSLQSNDGIMECHLHDRCEYLMQLSNSNNKYQYAIIGDKGVAGGDSITAVQYGGLALLGATPLSLLLGYCAMRSV